MPTSETGHARNVANFEQLIGYITAYGATYSPSKASIKLTSLTTTLTNATVAVQAVRVAKTALSNATNTREIAFKSLKLQVTKIIAALKATDAVQQTLDDAASINRKLKGMRASTAKTATTETDKTTTATKTVSVSQQSFDQQLSNFAQLLQLLTAEAKYIPNEADLKVDALTALLADLKAKNTAVITATVALSNARINRDKLLYKASTGVYYISMAVKEYIKSIFGTSGKQYKQLTTLKFTTH